MSATIGAREQSSQKVVAHIAELAVGLRPYRQLNNKSAFRPISERVEL
jgi:hypothetical protein